MRGGSYKRALSWDRVFYQRNVDLGLEPYCFECTSHSAKDSLGYIRIGRDGFYLLHRWVWWRATGEVPEVVLHKCDNPSCINLQHLASGSHKSNAQDRAVKNRGNRPFGNSFSAGRTDKRVLSASSIKEIRALHAKGLSNIKVAKMFLVDTSTIQRIVTGKTYKDVS